MIRPIGLKPEATEAVLIKLIGEQLADMYSNKSSEEYKMCGDITKSTTYDKLEQGIAELKTLKGFDKRDAEELKTMFLTLHRPIFKKMATEYIAKPEDRNTVFTAVFTVGYRILVAEISRIMISTVATPKGIVYKPDKTSRNQDMSKFIRYMNSSIETTIDEELKKVKTTTDTVQEGFNLASVMKVYNTGLSVFSNILSHLWQTGNPLATISTLINNDIEWKVREYENAVSMYESTKEAYNEYMQTPESQRKRSIEKRYEKMMNKYNMNVNKFKARIAHYDQRSSEKVKDDVNKELRDNKNNSTNKDSSNDNNDASNDFDF